MLRRADAERREQDEYVKGSWFFAAGCLRDDVITKEKSSSRNRRGRKVKKYCSMCSVKNSLAIGKKIDKDNYGDYKKSGDLVKKEICSTYSDNFHLRYEMTMLGEYASILEFDMAQRFYRYLDEYHDRLRAKVMTHLRVMVFIRI